MNLKMRVRVTFEGVAEGSEMVRHWYGPATDNRFEIAANWMAALTTHTSEDNSAMPDQLRTQLVSVEVLMVNEDGTIYEGSKPKGMGF